MAAHRVFYDQDTLVVLAIHPVEQPVDLSEYETSKRKVATLAADASEVPSVTDDIREPVLDAAGNVVLGNDGQPLLGRIINSLPRKLTQDFIDNHVAPVQETVDATKGKLALLEADKLDAFNEAIDAISDPKEKMAARLKFDAATWSRSDPVWNKLGKHAKANTKAVDDVWRAAGA